MGKNWACAELSRHSLTTENLQKSSFQKADANTLLKKKGKEKYELNHSESGKRNFVGTALLLRRSLLGLIYW